MMDSSTRSKPLIEHFINGQSHPFSAITVTGKNDLITIPAPDGYGMEYRSLGTDYYLTLGDERQPLPHFPTLSSLRYETLITDDEKSWEDRGKEFAAGGFPFYHLNRWRRKGCLSHLCVGVRWNGEKDPRTWLTGRGIRFPKHAVAISKMPLVVGQRHITWETGGEYGRHAVKLSRQFGHRYVVAAFSVIPEERAAREITQRLAFTTPISGHFDYPEEFVGTEIWLAYAYKPSEETCRHHWEKAQLKEIPAASA